MANKPSPNANVTISFSTLISGGAETEEYYLELEINPDDNNGKSSFVFGDTVNYRVYKDPRITGISTVVSDGVETPVAVNQKSLIEDEGLTFIATNQVNTQKAIDSEFVATLKAGTGAGTLAWTQGSTLVTGSKENSDTIPIVGIYLADYMTKYDKRKLAGVAEPADWPAELPYPVVVVVIGTVA